ncbi:MAG TPA: LuxR C-terminal-related transcriptional regulator [Anaerovoracaceae bacterium]|nr:LuxR C-terminal-related transcriptional regulator [Anaerovoracaceae bacterium]
MGLSGRAEAYINKFAAMDCKEIGLILREAQAELFLAQKKYQAALEMLAPISADTSLQEHHKKRIDLLLLEAAIYQESGSDGEALPRLRKALEIEDADKYIRSFVDRGNAMYDLFAKLIKMLRKRNDSDLLDRAEKFADWFNRKNKAIAKGSKTSWIELLSNRELEVLKLLADGLSYGETADTLCISLSTVKKHTGNLYDKLNAKSRMQAVNIAKANKLIE